MKRIEAESFENGDNGYREYGSSSGMVCESQSDDVDGEGQCNDELYRSVESGMQNMRTFFALNPFLAERLEHLLRTAGGLSALKNSLYSRSCYPDLFAESQEED